MGSIFGDSAKRLPPAIVKHLHPEVSDSIHSCKLAIPASNHVTINYLDEGTPNSLDITLDPPIKDINDGYNRILALRNEAWLALKVVSRRTVRITSVR